MADSGAALSFTAGGEVITGRIGTEYATLWLDELDPNLSTLQEYADFWKIPFSNAQTETEYPIVFSSRAKIAIDTPYRRSTIVTLNGEHNRREFANAYRLQIVAKDAFIRIPIVKDTTTTVHTTVFDIQGNVLEPELVFDGNTLMWGLRDTMIHVLGVDLVSDYDRLLYSRLDDFPSLRFRTVSRVPFSYRAIPGFLRNRAFKSAPDSIKDIQAMIGEVEALRALFLASIVKVAGMPVPRLGFWRRGRRYAFALTHDVETRSGLEEGSPQFLRVEKNLGIRSTWNIPTRRYQIRPELVRDLSVSGEICCHDTRHDGRLVLLDSTDMIERVRKGKEDLEALVEKSVHGFRAPLLQHSRRLLGSLGKAGYDFDSSVPSWEPLSPTSFRSHGVGSVFPFWTNGVLEIPVSLVQDHQYLRVLGRSVPETVDSLLSVSNWIGRLGGVCVLLVHPDYDFGLVENEGEYRRLLESFQNKECEALTLGQLTNWWATRTQAILKAEDGQVFIDSKCGQLSEVFDIQLVGGFDHDGFRVEHLS